MRKLHIILIAALVSFAGIVPTHEQQIQINIGQQIISLVNYNKGLMTQIYNIIWKDKTVAPCQVWTDLGVNATALRESFFGLANFINTEAPGTITLAEPAGFTMVENVDGTVTCTPPPAPSPSPSVSPSPSASPGP